MAALIKPIVTLPTTSDVFGLRIHNHKSEQIYSSDEVTWNQVDSFIVYGGSGLYKDYPALVGREIMVVQTMINPPPLDRRAIAHTVSINGTVVGVNGGSETTLCMVLMR